MNVGMRKLPEQETRIEVDPVQFGEDWPGLFIRGDNCFHLREILIGLLDQQAMSDKFLELQARSYIELLGEAIIDGKCKRS